MNDDLLVVVVRAEISTPSFLEEIEQLHKAGRRFCGFREYKGICHTMRVYKVEEDEGLLR